MSAFGLYHLLAPYFLAGFTFPREVDDYLSVVGVTGVTTAYDELATVTTGTLVWGDAPRSQRTSSGNGGLGWEDLTVRFRLTVPRDGAAFIDTAAQTLAAPELSALLDRFLPIHQVGATPTEYPGVRFRLELMLEELWFELGSDWRPGQLDADHRIVRDLTDNRPVRIVLPKVVLAYEQADDFQSPPRVRLASWGGGGFDAPASLLAGEVVRMEPPIAAYQSGRLGFGLGQVIVDFDPDNTPPEVLQFFGTDESFEGVYVQSARVYWADEGKDLALNVGVKDLLISFDGEVSFDVSADLIGPETTLSAALKLVDQGKDVPVPPGRKGPPPDALYKGAHVKVTATATGQVDVTGGVPPITVSLRAGVVELYDPATGLVSFAGLPPGEHTLFLHVEDSGPEVERQSYDEDIELTLVAAAAPTTPAGVPADRPAVPGALPEITVSGVAQDGDHALIHDGNAGGTRERFRVTGLGTPAVTANGTPVTTSDGTFELNVPEDTAGLPIIVSWPPLTSAPQAFMMRFKRDWPPRDQFAIFLDAYVNDRVDDAIYENNHVAGQSERGTKALRAWLAQLAAGGPLPDIDIDAYASYELDEREEADESLSARRLDVAVAAAGTFAQVTDKRFHGFIKARDDGRKNDGSDRVAIITATTTKPAATLNVTVSRGHRPPQGAPAQPQPVSPPKPLPKKPPGVFRRMGIRVKVIRNDPVLVELTGQLDFETALEASLRNPQGQAPLPAGGSLELKQQAGAVAQPAPNAKDGVVDFRLTVTHDPATHAWTEALAIGAHPDDLDGLLQMTNQRAGGVTASTRLKDMLGSVLILAPIIGSTAGALDPRSADGYVLLGGVIVGAAAVGAAGFVRTEKITLYGAELRLRQYIPPGDPARLTDAGVLFDYGVEFGVDISHLGISTGARPLKVRYRALGFNIGFAGGGYQPIFDTSKGYELDLSDPGLFKLPSPIDNVLRILGARIAKVNPLTIELDLGMKVDLGVVTIDRFKVKLPVDPPGVPTILPSGIKVDVAKVLLGSGYVNIVEPPAEGGDDQPGFGGIEGAFDVTLVPVKLRIAASLGIRPVNAGGRRATAVFLGLIIDLPAAIPLAQSGIGIYGFSGLFAMHYKRLEHDPDPTDAVGPAILWLRDAGGEPAKLVNNGVQLWGPELDRWSFGVGISLGTMEGGFLINLRGMFVLELPGPRILIFVKILIIKELPDLKPATDLIVGILGVIDLDIARRSFTIGVIVDLEIKDIVALVVPVELFTKLDDFTRWHLYLGTFGAPASALVLNIVRGFGYVMIAGHDIEKWPGYGQLRTLPGMAMAAGIGAAIVFGDEGAGLYLKVSARADVAVSFSPRLVLFGRLQLEGELRLFIVSVGAHGLLDVEAPDPTRVDGEICGHVDFFFFSVEGCVHVTIGPDSVPPQEPPKLTRNVWLQSHAPVITAGQGGDRPIDASLGDAIPKGSTQPQPIVPIDSVPVIQFLTVPDVSGTTTFTAPIGPPPVPPGWASLGGGRKVRYALKALRLTGGPAPAPGLAPTAWRPDPTTSPTSGRTTADLALLSNVPMMGARAMERSADLRAAVDTIWQGVCTPVAPAAPILWTFCGQRLGPSSKGWTLTGHAWPDPPGTRRDTPPETELRISESPIDPAAQVIDIVLGHTPLGGADTARVIGPNRRTGDGVPGDPDWRCVTLTNLVHDGDPNPLNTQDGFRVTVLDRNGVPIPVLRLSGIGLTRGLDVGWRTEIWLPQPAAAVAVTLVRFAIAATVSAYDANGTLVGKTTMTVPQHTPETLVVTGKRIVRAVVDAPQNEMVLVEVCASDLDPDPVPPTPEQECRRALQLPEWSLPGGKGEIDVTHEVTAMGKGRPRDRWIDLWTGALHSARLYLALTKDLLNANTVTVDQLDAAGAVLRSDPLTALSPVAVTGVTGGLPVRWTDPSGPWRTEVEPVATFMATGDLTGLVRLVVTVVPSPKTRRLRIRVGDTPIPQDHPAVVLAVVEALTAAEADRAAAEQTTHSGQLETLLGYLNGTAKVPLLAPGTPYALEIDYVPTTLDTNPDGTTHEAVHATTTDTFLFRTDDAPPDRLDAYVIGSNPRHEERFVFADEVVSIVFNDLQIVQLYGAYQKRLVAVLRAADGSVAPSHEILGLEEVPAIYTSPLFDTLDAMAHEGAFPCLGTYHVEGHGAFTLAEPLRPSIAYTLDIEMSPPNAPAAGRAVVPLFRRQFTTGRFVSLEALAGDMRSREPEHAAITGPLTGLPTGSGMTPDAVIEAALTAAGLPAPQAPASGGTVILWRPAAGGRHVPHALLLDAVEPLWRTREVPRLEKVPEHPDPTFQRVVPGVESSLELRTAGHSHVRAYVRSPSGTRTIVLLDDAAWPAAGAAVTIDAVRPASDLYGTPERRATVISLDLGGSAPWEAKDA
ncbi:hypothetical protein J5X84_40705 [Streptosporangiaceae bacterium NEAU-GS5]|nr:hypothetical protein [Streptosporangiaceae bacterium NEAU-GS5]